jgi:MFS superfamily sulfate permease-like transporter
MKRFNWQLWLGLVLAVVAFVSYFVFFSQYEVTRDVPWASFVLFLIAIALLVSGWRRAPRKILASIVAVLGFVVAGLFIFSVTVGSKDLPAAQAAPAIAQRAPGFTLPDTRGQQVSLSNVLAQSNGVLLIFYRGYW